MTDWKEAGRLAVFEAAWSPDPNVRPLFRIKRRWWKLWEPRYRVIEGVSRADLARAHGIDLSKPDR